MATVTAATTINLSRLDDMDQMKSPVLSDFQFIKTTAENAKLTPKEMMLRLLLGNPPVRTLEYLCSLDSNIDLESKCGKVMYMFDKRAFKFGMWQCLVCGGLWHSYYELKKSFAEEDDACDACLNVLDAIEEDYKDYDMSLHTYLNLVGNSTNILDQFSTKVNRLPDDILLMIMHPRPDYDEWLMQFTDSICIQTDCDENGIIEVQQFKTEWDDHNFSAYWKCSKCKTVWTDWYQLENAQCRCCFTMFKNVERQFDCVWID